MNVINCTPHEINLLTEEANIAYPPSGIVTHVNATSVMMPSPLPMVRTIFGDITGLPEPMDHTYFIVSGMVLSALGGYRPDVIAPDTSPASAVRDSQGRMIGVKRFTC